MVDDCVEETGKNLEHPCVAGVVVTVQIVKLDKPTDLGRIHQHMIFDHLNFEQAKYRRVLRESGMGCQKIHVAVSCPAHELCHELGSVWRFHGKKDLVIDLCAGRVGEAVASWLVQKVLYCLETRSASVQLINWKVEVESVSCVPELTQGGEYLVQLLGTC